MSEEFHIPSLNVIASSKGFSIEVLGRTGLRYVEDGRSVTIDSEVLAHKAGIAVFAGSLSEWETAQRGSKKSDVSERARILNNIQRAFAWRGEKLEITPDNWRSV